MPLHKLSVRECAGGPHDVGLAAVQPESLISDGHRICDIRMKPRRLFWCSPATISLNETGPRKRKLRSAGSATCMPFRALRSRVGLAFSFAQRLRTHSGLPLVRAWNGRAWGCFLPANAVRSLPSQDCLVSTSGTSADDHAGKHFPKASSSFSGPLRRTFRRRTAQTMFRSFRRKPIHVLASAVMCKSGSPT